MAEHPLTRAQAERFARSGNLRDAAASNPHLPLDLVLELADHEDERVRLAASMHPGLTEPQRAAFPVRIEPETRAPQPSWTRETGDAAAIELAVGSAHIGLRRSVTANPNLTPEQVRRLAGDDDPIVRLLLCERRDDVPGDTLLDVYLNGRSMSAGWMPAKPTFPRHGLAVLADHENPRARRLVFRDPEASPELVERLTRDPDAIVRQLAAADGRILVDRLPGLLEEPEASVGVAANPRLPRHLMERILTDAGL